VLNIVPFCLLCLIVFFFCFFSHTDQLSRHVFIIHASNAISVHYVVSESVAGCILVSFLSRHYFLTAQKCQSRFRCPKWCI